MARLGTRPLRSFAGRGCHVTRGWKLGSRSSGSEDLRRQEAAGTGQVLFGSGSWLANYTALAEESDCVMGASGWWLRAQCRFPLHFPSREFEHVRGLRSIPTIILSAHTWGYTTYNLRSNSMTARDETSVQYIRLTSRSPAVGDAGARCTSNALFHNSSSTQLYLNLDEAPAPTGGTSAVPSAFPAP